MVFHRQKDHAAHLQKRRVVTWEVAMLIIARRRLRLQNRTTNMSSLLYKSLANYHMFATDYALRQLLVDRISSTDFAFNFNALSNEQCLVYFRFCKEDMPKVIKALAWPSQWCSTERNQYRTSPLLSTCVLLRRFASPCRWKDLELLFGKHCSQLSEIFWEALEHFFDTRGHLLSADISAQYMAQNVGRYAEAIREKRGVLDNCIGFIDGTVIGVARPAVNALQNVVYNGHKKKHALKFQVVMSLDGLILHAHGPMEGRRHDWTLYMQSEMDRQLEDTLFVDGKQFCIYGDSGYNFRVYLEVPFQGSLLTAEMRAFNTAMSTVRVCVEWIFKEVKLHWTSVDFKRKMRIHESPVGLVYSAAMLLSNIRNCIYNNTVSQYFDCAPPSLDDYLVHKQPPSN